ncbi:telomere binding protein Rap1 [Schizosaccharomyces japonicus yFS275]|uniref:DNA-binding protein RAP1 n=1 Tax=Schizosaccharomyces japonicus (strain yFS275 / FY16936) TaxID=402676 RepID=B6K3A8_SCHJY|nr:telomere binding protein Rap1 [Schizosaccharomyces japonicus yFS275]EEB07965.2 telomere binding protein Rap1 [Schizosaccharomyces japonicus yFS275]
MSSTNLFVHEDGRPLLAVISENIDNASQYAHKFTNYGGNSILAKTFESYHSEDIRIGRVRKSDLQKRDSLPLSQTRPIVSELWIDQCIEQGKLLSISSFVNTPFPQAPNSPGSKHSTQKRVPFSFEDQRILVHFIHRKGVQSNGNKVYQELEEKYPQHTYHSWRQHYLKQLKPYLPEPVLPPIPITNEAPAAGGPSEQVSNEQQQNPRPFLRSEIESLVPANRAISSQFSETINEVDELAPLIVQFGTTKNLNDLCTLITLRYPRYSAEEWKQKLLSAFPSLNQDQDMPAFGSPSSPMVSQTSQANDEMIDLDDAVIETVVFQENLRKPGINYLTNTTYSPKNVEKHASPAVATNQNGNVPDSTSTRQRPEAENVTNETTTPQKRAAPLEETSLQAPTSERKLSPEHKQTTPGQSQSAPLPELPLIPGSSSEESSASSLPSLTRPSPLRKATTAAQKAVALAAEHVKEGFLQPDEELDIPPLESDDEFAAAVRPPSKSTEESDLPHISQSSEVASERLPNVPNTETPSVETAPEASVSSQGASVSEENSSLSETRIEKTPEPRRLSKEPTIRNILASVSITPRKQVVETSSSQTSSSVAEPNTIALYEAVSDIPVSVAAASTQPAPLEPVPALSEGSNTASSAPLVHPDSLPSLCGSVSDSSNVVTEFMPDSTDAVLDDLLEYVGATEEDLLRALEETGRSVRKAVTVLLWKKAKRERSNELMTGNK